MAQEIVFYHSAMQGAPSATLNAAGALLAVLDGCLVNGFNVNSISTLTQSAGVATATTSGTNGYSIGDWVEVSGATPAAYNGRVKVTGKPGTNQFTYAVPGGTASPASGTMSSKYPPAGWTKTVAGTDIAAYQSGAGSLGHWLQVEDNNPYADSNLSIRTRICGGWTLLDTATTLGTQVKHLKLTGGWMVFADARTVWLFCGNIGAQTRLRTIAFGEGSPFYEADEFFLSKPRESGTFQAIYNETSIAGLTEYPPSLFPWVAPSSGTESNEALLLLLRGVSQIGGDARASISALPATSRRYASSSSGVHALNQDLTVPSLADNTIPAVPIFVTEGISGQYTLRGRLRGAMLPLGGLTTGFANSFQRLDSGVIDGVLQPLVLMTNNVLPNPSTGAPRQLAFRVDGAW